MVLLAPVASLQIAPSEHGLELVTLAKPFSDQILPSGQEIHSLSSLVALSMVKVPAGHRDQAFDSEVDLKYPTGQIVGHEVPVPLHWKPLGHLDHSVDPSVRVK